MTKDEIMKYVMNTPGNTNVSVLGPMVDAVSGVTPTGKITITENGSDIDVAQYAKADVNVQGEPTYNPQTVTITNSSSASVGIRYQYVYINRNNVLLWQNVSDEISAGNNSEIDRPKQALTSNAPGWFVVIIGASIELATSSNGCVCEEFTPPSYPNQPEYYISGATHYYALIINQDVTAVTITAA